MDIKYPKKEFTIRDFGKLMKADTGYNSKDFTINNCKWKLTVYRRKEGKKDLAVYLYAADASSLLPGWSIDAEFTLTVVNQSPRKNSEKTKNIKHKFQHKFRKEKDKCDCSSFIRLEELKEANSGFICDNKCIVEVKFRVVIPTGLVYLEDLGRIQKKFVPLLKEVWCPSLLDGMKNQTRELVFNDLGRVLEFLKEKKWKHMKNEQSREELRVPWRELKKSGLDLPWLKPRVECALSMNGYRIKTREERERLNKDLEKLEGEKKKLEKKLRKKKTDLEYANRFRREEDLDEKIGYPKPETLK